MWSTTYRGPLLIHAAKSKTSYDLQRMFNWTREYGVKMPRWEDMAKGAILGIVDVVGCRPNNDRRHESFWAEQVGYAWILANPQPFREPIPFRGMQGLFDVSDDVIADLI
jgi:hypothetical protein